MEFDDYSTSNVIIHEPRERMMLVCPDCGVVEGVDKERWTSQSIFANNPPVCSACGAVFIPIPDDLPEKK